jgi:hypothetical protein
MNFHVATIPQLSDSRLPTVPAAEPSTQEQNNKQLQNHLLDFRFLVGNTPTKLLRKV